MLDEMPVAAAKLPKGSGHYYVTPGQLIIDASTKEPQYWLRMVAPAARRPGENRTWMVWRSSTGMFLVHPVGYGPEVTKCALSDLTESYVRVHLVPPPSSQASPAIS